MLTIEGQIVYQDKTARGRIEIGDNGLISAIKEETGKADLVLGEELIFPGFLDLHVHARESVDHSQDYKEDFVTAGAAAINGGVVAFADMPNNIVAPVDEESYLAKEKLTKKTPVEVVLYAGIGPVTNPLQRKVPYKVFMGKSVGDLFFESFEDLEKILEKYQGQYVSFHCEDPKILKENISQVLHKDKRPETAEVSAVDFALQIIEKYNLHGKICHCSTIDGLNKIVEAKKRGVKVTVEVTPHHLYFDESNSVEKNMLQVNPPIRQSKENRLALIQALKNGDIDYLATDHAPHSPEEKEKGMSGIPHLDTYGCFITWLIKEYGFTPQDVARFCSFAPGQFLNQFTENKYGKIVQGFVGSFTIIDVNSPTVVKKANLKTKSGWSPFEGVTFPGSVVYTVVKGKVFKH